METERSQLERDLAEVGVFLRQAIHEIAYENGGNDFATEVDTLTAGDDILPDVQALIEIKRRFPGQEAAVMQRCREIQAENHARERAAFQQPANRLRLIGKGMLLVYSGFTLQSFNSTDLKKSRQRTDEK